MIIETMNNPLERKKKIGKIKEIFDVELPEKYKLEDLGEELVITYKKYIK